MVSEWLRLALFRRLHMVRNTLDYWFAVSIDNAFRDRDRETIAAAIETLRSSQSR